MTSRVVELNVGGVVYATTMATLTSDADSLLSRWFSEQSPSLATDQTGRYSGPCLHVRWAKKASC